MRNKDVDSETGEIVDFEKLVESFARKSEKYWATMRNNLQLLHRSDFVDQLAIDLVREELSDILDSGILTYPHTLEQHGVEEDMTLQEKKSSLGISSVPIDRTWVEDKFLQDLANKADKVRKGNWSWRIGTEAQEKHLLGWYPFFVTLTVDPSKADPKEIWKDTRELRKYIRRLSDIVCKELGHPPARKKPYRPESDYVTYAGVIEHGKSREHHHGHFVIWMREIPDSWKTCPNFGIRDPARRIKNECRAMSTVWPWSGYDTSNGQYLSPALYFRSVGDIWEKSCNFDLPMKNGKPMVIGTPRAAGHYITKYLSKEHKEWHHRMKATRNLGMKTLKNLIAQQDLETCQKLATRAATAKFNLSLTMIHSVPLGLVRSLAKQREHLILYRRNQLDLKTLLTSKSDIFLKMLSSVRSGARPDRMDSLQFFDWVGQFHQEVNEYSEDSLREAHKRLAKYFPQEKYKIKHIKIGANDVGHT